jgi:hypothetical protein
MTVENTSLELPADLPELGSDEPELDCSAPAPPPPGIPWSTRLLAVAGFLLAVSAAGLYLSQQIALDRARNYLRDKYNANLELPIKDIRPDFVAGATASGKPLPPLGFCWTIVIETGVAEGEVLINPWNHEVLDWRMDL